MCKNLQENGGNQLMKKVKIGILGLGTVGGGTYDILKMNKELITKRTGVDYEVSKVLEINMKAIEAHGVDKAIVTQDVDEVLTSPDVDIVVESLGGVEPSTSFMDASSVSMFFCRYLFTGLAP